MSCTSHHLEWLNYLEIKQIVDGKDIQIYELNEIRYNNEIKFGKCF